jgi:hypothetical protein
MAHYSPAGFSGSVLSGTAVTRRFPAAALVLAVLPAARPAAAPAAEPAWPRGVFLSETRLAVLRARLAAKAPPTADAYRKVRQAAEAELSRQPRAPGHWEVPGYYSNAEGHRKAKEGLQDDANAAYLLALVYRMEGDERFAQAAARLVNGWTKVQTLSQKDDSGLSFSYHFPALIFAADLLKRWKGWPAAEQEAFRRFVREKALPQNTMAAKNNWGNWGLVLVLASAAHLGDRDLFDTGVARWKELLESQVAEDGHLIHEVTRNNGVGDYGIWYSNFSLMPQTLAAEIARVNGPDLYEYRAPNGRTLRSAFDRLAPWARRPATFPFFKGDPKKLHGADYVSYFEILNARWPNADATAMLEQLRPLTAQHAAPALTFTHGGLPRDDGR